MQFKVGDVVDITESDFVKIDGMPATTAEIVEINDDSPWPFDAIIYGHEHDCHKGLYSFAERELRPIK